MSDHTVLESELDLNLLHRERADLADSKEEYEKDTEIAAMRRQADEQRQVIADQQSQIDELRELVLQLASESTQQR